MGGNLTVATDTTRRLVLAKKRKKKLFPPADIGGRCRTAAVLISGQ